MNIYIHETQEHIVSKQHWSYGLGLSLNKRFKQCKWPTLSILLISRARPRLTPRHRKLSQEWLDARHALSSDNITVSGLANRRGASYTTALRPNSISRVFDQAFDLLDRVWEWDLLTTGSELFVTKTWSKAC